MSAKTKYREPWFLSNDNDTEEWVITDGVEIFPIADATQVEFGLAVKGTVERASRKPEAAPSDIDREALIAEARETMKRQEWMPASLAIRLANALEDASQPVQVEVTELDKRIAAARRNVGPDPRLADPYALGKLDGLKVARAALETALGGGES